MAKTFDSTRIQVKAVNVIPEKGFRPLSGSYISQLWV